MEDLEEFLTSHRLEKVTPGYLSTDDLIPEDMGPDNFKSLVDMCQTYSPDSKMVVYAAVCIWSEVTIARVFFRIMRRKLYVLKGISATF